MKINYKQLKYVESYGSSQAGLSNVITGDKWRKMRQYKLTRKCTNIDFFIFILDTVYQ